MKVGDLVELSAYGSKLQWLARYRGLLAIILEVIPTNGNCYVQWMGKNMRQVNRTVGRRDIKHLKGKVNESR